MAIDYSRRRRTKIDSGPKAKDRQLPMIDLNKRVINFGDDQQLFNVVVQLIMKRVDLGPVDLDPGTSDDLGALGADPVDLDVISPTGSPGTGDDGEPAADDGARVPLSRRFGLYRHPDRYGAR